MVICAAVADSRCAQCYKSPPHFPQLFIPLPGAEMWCHGDNPAAQGELLHAEAAV